VKGLRALSRIELRQLARHRGRSLLILLAVAVPVAAVVGASTIVAIVEPTSAERAAQAMGRAELKIAVDDWEQELEARKLLGSDARAESWFFGFEEVATPGRRLRAKLYAFDVAALDLEPNGPRPTPLSAGMLHLEEGRMPEHAAEVALSPIVLEGLGRSVGETVTLAYGPVRTITGVVAEPGDLKAPIVLRTSAHVEHGVTRQLLAEPGETSIAAARLRTAGFSLTTRDEAEATGDAFAVGVVFAAGCIGFFEAALVIAAAFAVGLRRRQVEIGLLRSTGASMAGISLSLVVSAAALAFFGGLAGAALGLVGAAAVHPWLGGWTGRLTGSFEVPVFQIATAVLLGVLAAILAAALPARNAARVPIRESLGGRRPVATRSANWLALGLALLATGLGLLAFAPRSHPLWGPLGVIGGPLLGILGFGAVSPWLLDALARRAAPLPLAWRLALRDAGRFRARNGPVVTAVLAGMSMSVTVAVFVASLGSAIDTFPSKYRDDQLLVEGPGAEEVARRLRGELGALAAAPLHAAYAHGEPVRARRKGAEPGPVWSQWVAVGDGELLRALGAEAVVEAFAAGRLLSLGASAAPEDVELSTWLSGRPLGKPGIEALEIDQRVAGPSFAVEESAAQALGFELGPPLDRSLAPWLLRFDEPVSRELLERARAIAATTAGTTVDAARLHGRPGQGVYWAILAVCALTGLIVVVVAAALSAAESAGDERILHTVGAAPALLRRHMAARAAYLAFLGCALAVPAGLITARALFGTLNFPLDFVMPWRDVAIVVLALPTVVYAGAWLVGSPGRPKSIPFQE